MQRANPTVSGFHSTRLRRSRMLQPRQSTRLIWATSMDSRMANLLFTTAALVKALVVCHMRVNSTSSRSAIRKSVSRNPPKMQRLKPTLSWTKQWRRDHSIPLARTLPPERRLILNPTHCSLAAPMDSAGARRLPMETGVVATLVG